MTTDRNRAVKAGVQSPMSTRRILRGLAALFGVLALSFAAFVWWKLQPHPDRQPLPPALIALDSPEGKALLEDADARADYQPLLNAFEPQSLVSFCGVASSVAVLNAMGGHVSQQSFFNEDTDSVRSRLQVTFGGMSLPELAGLLEAHGALTSVRHANATTLEAFRTALDTNLGREGDFILVNYQREALGQPKVGHISPLAAYDGDTDKVLVLDTAGYKYPPTWVPVELLFAAMNTLDSASGETRGYVEVAPREAPAPD